MVAITASGAKSTKISLSNFGPQAVDAMQFAVDIWSSLKTFSRKTHLDLKLFNNPKFNPAI